MKAYSSREIIKILNKDSWYLVDTTGDHYQFKHPIKKGKITVPHPNKNLKIRTIKSILKQAGIEIN